MATDTENATRLGFTVKSGPRNGDPDWYVKGAINVWKVGTSFPKIRIWWKVADLIDNRYLNHRDYPTLEEALESEQ